MKTKLFSVYDHITQTYGQPFPAMSPADACRQITTVIATSPQSLITNNPKDYTLFEIGEFDDHKGEFFNCAPPSLVAHVFQLAKATNITPINTSSTLTSEAQQ